MSCRRLLTSLATARTPCVVAYPNIRAIHFLPTISTYPGTVDDAIKIDRHGLLLTESSSFKTFKRYKSGKKKQKPQQDEESDDDDDKEEDELSEFEGQSSKVWTMTARSMRIDLVVKTCMAMSRSKAEVALYDSKIRVNGLKILKKSYQVQTGDVIDLIRGPSPDNPSFIIVNRVIILSATSDNNGYKIKCTRDKALVIENYEDAWAPLEG